jgi:butyryl-CoA dehydrogenase
VIELTDIQKEVQQTFRRFADSRVMPAASRIDEAKEFPLDLFKEAGSMGFFGMRYPESAGGTGMDVVSYALAVMELARGSMSLAAACTMQSLMGTWFLYRFGDEDIRKNYFEKALLGLKIGAICMTEPDAGSDLMGISTVASKKGNHYIINGSKTWVTSAPVADYFTVFAKIEGQENLTVFFVPASTAGVQVGKAIEKMGVRGSLTSEVSFNHVEIPERYLLGEPGGGTKCLFEILAEIRIMTAALAVGIAQGARDIALQYTRERVQFGKPIGKFQAVQLRIAEIEVQLETARLYTLHAAALSDKNMPRHRESMMAKLYASEVSNTICDSAARILASYGYATEYHIERLLRDARFTLIGGGTSEILKMNIAKDLEK